MQAPDHPMERLACSRCHGGPVLVPTALRPTNRLPDPQFYTVRTPARRKAPAAVSATLARVPKPAGTLRLSRPDRKVSAGQPGPASFLLPQCGALAIGVWQVEQRDRWCWLMLAVGAAGAADYPGCDKGGERTGQERTAGGAAGGIQCSSRGARGGRGPAGEAGKCPPCGPHT